jgi:hypothetical protein
MPCSRCRRADRESGRGEYLGGRRRPAPPDDYARELRAIAAGRRRNDCPDFGRDHFRLDKIDIDAPNSFDGSRGTSERGDTNQPTILVEERPRSRCATFVVPMREFHVRGVDCRAERKPWHRKSPW